jgi:hypothetical protein
MGLIRIVDARSGESQMRLKVRAAGAAQFGATERLLVANGLGWLLAFQAAAAIVTVR